MSQQIIYGRNNLTLTRDISTRQQDPIIKTDEELYQEAMENIPEESIEKITKVLDKIDKEEKTKNGKIQPK